MLRTIPEPHNSLLQVRFSPTDSRKLASVADDGQIHVWDVENVESGEKIRSVCGSTFAFFSPDGRMIATAGGSGTRDVLLVDVESGTTRLRMVAHTHEVFSAAFSVDGSTLATGSRDGTCKVSSSSSLLLSSLELSDTQVYEPYEPSSQGVGLVDRSAPPHHHRRGTPCPLRCGWARLGAGQAGGGGFRDGAPPAARRIVAGACAGSGGGPNDPRPRVMVPSRTLPRSSLGMG